QQVGVSVGPDVFTGGGRGAPAAHAPVLVPVDKVQALVERRQTAEVGCVDRLAVYLAGDERLAFALQHHPVGAVHVEVQCACTFFLGQGIGEAVARQAVALGEVR